MTLAQLRCRCGTVHGTVDVAPRSGLQLVCYCADCRAFAHALERPDLLDAGGGSGVFITTPARVRLAGGLEQLRVLRLSPGGMFRWYWSCCNSPLANTMDGAGIPAISLHRSSIVIDDAAALGPVTGVNARAATGPVDAHAEQTTSLSTMARIIGFLLKGWLRGAAKPNPLYIDGKPRCAPRVLDAAERAALDARARLSV
jgi:hypothetical protein